MFYEIYGRTPESHNKYLKSHYWRKRKIEFFSRNPRTCVVCSTSSNIHLHHATYKNLYNEPDEDLVSLCGVHHGELHKAEVTSELSIEDATKVYLACRANLWSKEVQENSELFEAALKLLEKIDGE